MLLDRFSGQVPDRVVPRATDIAVITYTSGTTGVPKGATNTHGNVVVGGQTYRDWFKLGARDTLLGIAPLFHVTGLSGHIATALSAKMPLVLDARFDLGVVLDAIREHRPTFTVARSRCSLR